MGSRATLMADLRYAGSRLFQNNGGRFGRASNFTVAGIGGTARIYRAVDLPVGIDKVFDRAYLLVDGYPEAGRTAHLNLRYRSER